MLKKRGLVIVVFVLLLSVLPSVSATVGCFTEPSAPSVCTVIDRAVADAFCAVSSKPAECFARYFFDSVSCDQLAACAPQPGTWCLDSCRQVTYPAQCANRTLWINQTTQPIQCRAGCVVCDRDPSLTSDNVCQFGMHQQEAAAFCSGLVGYSVGFFDSSLTSTACTNLCPAFVSPRASLNGFVFNASGSPLQGATLRAFDRVVTTSSQGSYFLDGLPLGSVSVFVSRDGHFPVPFNVTLAAGDSRSVNITLLARARGSLSGNVITSSGQALSSVLLLVTGATQDHAFSDSGGAFLLSDLPYGEYTLAAQKEGYQTLTVPFSLTRDTPSRALPLTLNPISEGIIRGRVVDTAGAPVPFSQISFNSIFGTFSASTGFYSFTVFADTHGKQYTLLASKNGYGVGIPSTVTVHTGETVTQDLVLMSAAGGCSFPAASPVLNFSVQHVLGQPSVALSWQKPCARVRGYVINRTLVPTGGQSSLFYVDAIPGFSDPVSFVDSSANWSTSYRYSIRAIYTNVQYRLSEARIASITTGDARCMGKYTSGDFLEFCDGNRLRKTCNLENRIVDAHGIDPADCSARGATFFCSGPDAAGDTYCRDSSICSAPSQLALPFGLWFTRTGCYGDSRSGFYSNFCTFDQSTTIFDSCSSCQTVRSCFDYKGKDACTTNNCQVGVCSWVDALTELGTGYCVPNGYAKSDHCSDCSSAGSLFRNALCTPSICRALGSCYSRVDARSCASCTDQSSCYDFSSSDECTGGVAAGFLQGSFVSSHDICSIGRCAWDNAARRCFKDGNADGVDDCLSFGVLQSGLCRRDRTAPNTIINSSLVTVNAASGIVSFAASDASGVSRLFVCVDRTNTCVPGSSLSFDYRGQTSLTLNLLTLGLPSFYNGPGMYYVRYSSEDIFFNKEDVQSRSFAADIISPQFFSLTFNVTPRSTGSDVTFTLLLDEPGTCVDRFSAYSRNLVFSELPSQRSDTLIITYTNVPDGLYRYEANCTDGYGNKASRSLDIVDVDSVRAIGIVSPSSVLQQTTFQFIVNTSDDASCDLYEGSTLIEHMSTSTFTLHQSLGRSFPTNIFSSDWNVRCRMLASNQILQKFIPFSIDQMAPTTVVRFTSDDGLVQLRNGTGWDAVMGSPATVHLDCSDLPIQGYGCRETRFCLVSSGSDCVPSSLSVPPIISNTSRICFFSVDKGGSSETVRCGNIFITPSFGISLVTPRYGLSSTIPFSLQIAPAVPSSSCAWGAGNFNFTSHVNLLNIFIPINPTLFEKSDFSSLVSSLFSPGSLTVSIRCNATTGRISPAQVFEIGYDPTPPVITAASANPSLVINGNSVQLLVHTDEKTICRYGKASSFDQLLGFFPGYATADFSLDHTTTLPLSGPDDGLSHTFNVSCMNRAENISSLVPLTFSVNFSAEGSIIQRSPLGVIANTSVELFAITNKNAFCDYLDITYKSFAISGNLDHRQSLIGLSEGLHTFPFRCTFVDSGALRSNSIDFTVDTSPPIMESIFDGNVTCNPTRLRASFTAHDTFSSVASYDYTLMDQASSVSVLNGSAASGTISLSGLNLSLGRTYVFHVRARDAAGNIGTLLSSSGVVVLSSNSTRCRERRVPVVTVAQNVTRDSVSVSLQCMVDGGCSAFRYGLGDSALRCSASRDYSLPLSIHERQFVCYFASTDQNITTTGGMLVIPPDSDRDGILDPFDQCPNSVANGHVDSTGCSMSQHRADTDGDKLPDSWELEYDTAACKLSFREKDSDHDGVFDGDEDYDGDGTSNSDEYDSNSPPCDSVDTDGDGMPDNWEKRYSLNSGDRSDAFTDPDHDGLTNLEEFLLHTDPTRADSDGDGIFDGGERTSKTDPLDSAQHPVDNDHDGIADSWETMYCRGNCDPSADADSDGATSFQEYVWNTHPGLGDTDGDGMPDGWEVQWGTLPRERDGDKDYDDDSVSNGQEYTLHTNPHSSDTDGDGMPDGWEVHYGLNASGGAGVSGADGDFDGDGLSNVQEYKYGTNPLVGDTDGDGWSDSAEVASGSNPTDMQSIPSSLGTFTSISIIFIIIGFLLVFSGGAYLVYTSLSHRKSSTSHTTSSMGGSNMDFGHRHDVPMHKLYEAVRKRREEREQTERTRRRALFDIFGQAQRHTAQSPVKSYSEKKHLPELEEALQHPGSDFEKLKVLAERYLARRGALRGELASRERDVFERLAAFVRHSPHVSHSTIQKEHPAELKEVIKELSSIVQEPSRHHGERPHRRGRDHT